jgi:hypothetical protein
VSRVIRYGRSGQGSSSSTSLKTSRGAELIDDDALLTR